MTSNDVIDRLPRAQQEAIHFIDAQIESLEDQIENLKAARRALGYVEIVRGEVLLPGEAKRIAKASAPDPKPQTLPIPANRIQEGKRAGYDIDNNVLMAQIGCLLVDGPLPMGRIEKETGVSRGSLYPRMAKNPWFQVNGEKALAVWSLSPSGLEAAKAGFRSDARPAVETAANPSISAAV